MFKTVSKMLDTEQYSVQIAVHLPPKTKVTFFGSNNVDTAFFAGQHEVTIRNENGIILFCSSGFSSVSDAYDFVQKLSACVCLLSLKKKIGLRVNNSPQKINKPAILKCINNDPLNRDNRKIDGTINSFSTFIIPEHQKIVEDGSMLASPIPEFVPEQLFEMFSSIDSELDTTKVFQNAETELAFYIFSFNFIGNHPYSRFISLITCLEILSTELKSSTFTCNTIDKLNNFLKDYKKKETSVSGKKEINRLINRVSAVRLGNCMRFF